MHTSKGSLPSMLQEESTALLLDVDDGGDVLHNKALSAVITPFITKVLTLQYGFTRPDGEWMPRKTEAQSWLLERDCAKLYWSMGLWVRSDSIDNSILPSAADFVAYVKARELPPAEVCDMNPEAEERGLEADTSRSFIAVSKFNDGERLGVKPHNTNLTMEDYKVYIRVRDNLLEGVAGQTALTQGGIAWCLAWGTDLNTKHKQQTMDQLCHDGQYTIRGSTQGSM
ncbi:hypothetical protein BC835DRAFT_1309320 [Cytidiella melzeri]|nr:hypothetical protein BC835DRAFT_1309320 [Cytidiella melzeri]